MAREVTGGTVPHDLEPGTELVELGTAQVPKRIRGSRCAISATGVLCTERVSRPTTT